jgi:pyruvate formate lyase activating enzyme
MNKHTIGTYLHLQRLSTEDGPGIRTTVFLKGCLLQCGWCHNPESISGMPEVQWLADRCIDCRTCLEACPHGCLRMTDDGLVIDREQCEQCGTCQKECPSNAMELLGKRISAQKLYRELIKDKSYFEKSAGGVTLSGGEPALQANFSAALMGLLQSAGIHTALDTCGLASAQNLLKVLPHTDLVLYDLKEIDPKRHQDFTGQCNEVILKNLLLVRDYIVEEAPQTQLWIRTPLIPNATATQDNLEGIAAFLARELKDRVARWELCAFNNLSQEKYQRLGITWEYAQTPLLTPDELHQLQFWAQDAYIHPEVVIATGATQVEAG